MDRDDRLTEADDKVTSARDSPGDRPANYNPRTVAGRQVSTCITHDYDTRATSGDDVAMNVFLDHDSPYGHERTVDRAAHGSPAAALDNEVRHHVLVDRKALALAYAHFRHLKALQRALRRRYFNVSFA
jgi:hypothetical protein